MAQSWNNSTQPQHSGRVMLVSHIVNHSAGLLGSHLGSLTLLTSAIVTVSSGFSSSLGSMVDGVDAGEMGAKVPSVFRFLSAAAFFLFLLEPGMHLLKGPS